ncbi:MAG TPA: zinc ribbon domain-containing protein [Ktedonobacterales bacterium]
MQSGFCTNCGQPLAAGAVFCPSCGTRVEAPPAAASATTVNSVPPSAPPYTPGSNPPASFSPATSAPPAAPPKSQTSTLIGWLIGCLGVFLLVIILLVAAVIYGILSQKLIFFAIGLGGLFVVLLIAVAIEHQVRRLYRRFKGTLGVANGSSGFSPRYQGASRSYREQPHFSLFRFLFSLAVLAGLVYGGLFLYYTQEFTGNWSGVLTIGGVQQGVLANIQISLPLHSPTNPSFSDLPSLTFTQVEFKPTTARACVGSQNIYQLSGTASRLDASRVEMTLKTGAVTVPLHGAYNSGKFTLSGTSQGKPVTLILEKGSDQAGYLAICPTRLLATKSSRSM